MLHLSSKQAIKIVQIVNDIARELLLLCGSDKRDQDREITRAIGYLNDWKERGKP